MSHRYPDPDGTSNCTHGCGCWMGPYRSGGPDGVDPFGECPKAPPVRDHLVLSFKRGAWGNSAVWWKPDGGGYTSYLEEAGRYTREEALDIERWSCGRDNEYRRQGSVAVREADAVEEAHMVVDFNRAAELWRDKEDLQDGQDDPKE